MSAGDTSRADRMLELTATGTDQCGAVGSALAAVLAVARAEAPPGDGASAANAVAIRGQGPDLAGVVVELVNDLLAQLDANGAGFDAVRLDGLLRTGDGYTAWGYLLGEPSVGRPPVDLSLDGMPLVERAGGEVVLRIWLRRG
jgi:hypothetical protein